MMSLADAAKQLSRDLELSSRDIKSLRKMFQCNSCAYPNCLTVGQRLEDSQFKRCGKCKHVWYCSKECQKADWPNHKRTCEPSETDRKKLAQYFMANPLLHLFIEVLLVAALKILDDPSPQNMFFAQMCFGIEPADAKDFLRLFDPSAVADDKPMVGIPQIFSISSSRLDDEKNFSQGEISLWQQKREESNAAGYSSMPLCVMQWAFLDNTTIKTISTIVAITPTAMDIARYHTIHNNPFVVPKVFVEENSQTFTTTFSVKSVTEYINTSIRQDIKNQWVLRTSLSKHEKESIILAAQGKFSDGPREYFAMLQRIKAIVESTYHDAYRHYMECGVLRGHPLFPFRR